MVGRDSSVGTATRYGPGIELLIPVAERSQARFCCRSPAGIAGLKPAGGMDVCVVCCKYRQKTKFRIIKTKKEVRMKYKQNIREYKKEPGGGDIFRTRLYRSGAHPASYTKGTASLSRG